MLGQTCQQGVRAGAEEGLNVLIPLQRSCVFGIGHFHQYLSILSLYPRNVWHRFLILRYLLVSSESCGGSSCCILTWALQTLSGVFTRGLAGDPLDHLPSHIQPPQSRSEDYLEFSACVKAASVISHLAGLSPVAALWSEPRSTCVLKQLVTI